MKEHYWQTFCNDGVELFGTKCPTRAEAIKELKKAFRFDCEESLDFANYNDYYIQEVFETETAIGWGKEEHFRLTMGKRGGVKAVKIT